MDNWLKVLIAGACVMVIIASGRYVFGPQLPALGKSQEEMELFDLSGSDANDKAGVHGFCKILEGRIDSSETQQAKRLVNNCLKLGYLP